MLTVETVVTGPSHVLNETLIALTLHSAQPRCGVRGPAGVDYSDCAQPGLVILHTGDNLRVTLLVLGIYTVYTCLYCLYLFTLRWCIMCVLTPRSGTFSSP